MAKKNLSDQFASPSSESYGSLRGLIDTLHGLIIMIMSRLRLTQIRGSTMGDSKSDYDLGGRLRSHIEKISADGQPNAKPRAIRPASEADSHAPRKTTATAHESSQIAEHSKQKATSELLPRIHEQLQSKTMEHINISLNLAREGNTDGAELHIKLAENAMDTASRFMSDEEYEMLEQQVERRLESITRADRPNNAET